MCDNIQVIAAFGIGRVARSRDGNYSEGEIVIIPFCPVSEYCVVPSQALVRKIDPNDGVPLTDHLSLLGECYHNFPFFVVIIHLFFFLKLYF